MEITDDYAIMNRMVAEQTSTSLTVDTRFTGTRRNPEQCCSISKITVDNFTPAGVTRSLLEGMMREPFQMYEQMGESRSNMIG